MYADPSRALYTTFGMVESLEMTPAGQEKRSYLGRSYIGNVVKSIWVRNEYCLCRIAFGPDTVERGSLTAALDGIQDSDVDWQTGQYQPERRGVHLRTWYAHT